MSLSTPKKRALALAIPFLLIAGPAHAAEPVLGRWETQNHKAVVEIAPCGRHICGHIVKLLPAADAGVFTDIHNGDPEKRKRPLIGLEILLDYKEDGKEWTGHIYDPQLGNNYTSTMSRNPDGTLKIRGCLFIICKTQTWRPARD